MKTLKKVMAMTLAFATAMTMFVSASAFTDDADIQHEEAVGALSSLGIIKGNTDGSFAPKKTVTRGEMAKMIYVLRTGKDDGATAYSGLTTTFTDIANTWAQPYIKYCYSLGIINGRSATKFDPDATVTGAEAAKMLLVCIGYDPAKAGLTGSSWALQTAALGSDKGLFEDVYQDLYEALNRENAAQEIYNTLDAKTVRFDGDDNAYTDQNQNGTDMKTVGAKFLDLQTKIGELTVSGNIGLTTGGDDDKLIIKKVDGLSDSEDLDFSDVTTDYTSLLGQTVKVMYKTTTSTTGKKTNKVYGVYVSDETQVAVKAKASDLEGSSNEKKIKIDGKKYDVDANAKVYVKNAAADTDAGKLAEQKITGKDKNQQDVQKSLGELTNDELYTYVEDTLSESDYQVTAISNNDDDDIDLIIVDAKVPAKLTTVNKDNVVYKTLSEGKTSGAKSVAVDLDLDDDKPEIYKDYKKDDYVFVDVDLFTNTTVITKADSVKGKVAATKDNEVKINDTWYDITNTKAANAKSSLSLNKDATLYVYGTYAYYVDGTTATDLDTVLVKTAGKYKDLDEGYEVKAIFDDGTEKVINVWGIGSKIDDDKDTSTTVKAKEHQTSLTGLSNDTLYTYTEDDGDYVLVPVATADIDGATIGQVTETTKQEDGKTVVTSTAFDSDLGSIGNKDISDDAVIFLKYYSSGDKYKVITGKELQTYKTIMGSAVYVYSTSDKEITYAFVKTGENTSSDNTLYGVVTSAYEQKNADGDKVTYIDVLTADGEKTGVETDKKISLSKGDIVTFDGDYTNAVNIAKSAGAYGAISKYNADTGLVSFETGLSSSPSAAKIVKDTKVIYIDQKNGTWKVTTGTPAEATELPAGKTGYYANAYAIVNKDKEFDLLVYEVNDKIKDSTEKAVELTK